MIPSFGIKYPKLIEINIEVKDGTINPIQYIPMFDTYIDLLSLHAVHKYLDYDMYKIEYRVCMVIGGSIQNYYWKGFTKDDKKNSIELIDKGVSNILELSSKIKKQLYVSKNDL